jgi:SpoVK/Ycf46/Vps4 family AAA+-type ATPase
MLLGRAVDATQATYGTKNGTDPFRGLYISPLEAAQLLAREPGIPFLRSVSNSTPGQTPGAISERLDWIARVYGLTVFDVDVMVLSLAPELDLRYERLYAYLQDDVTRRRPSVDLALNLLSPSAEAKLAHRMRFAPGAALLDHDLVHLIPDSNQTQPSLLSHYLKLDEQILRLLLGQQSLDSRLAPFCHLVMPPASFDALDFMDDAKRALPALARQTRDARRPLRLYFHGPDGIGKRRMAEAIAAGIDRRLLIVDLPRAVAAKTEFEQVVKLLFREAWFQSAVLYLDGLDSLPGNEDGEEYQRLVEALAEDGGITILAGTRPWLSPETRVTGVVDLQFPLPEFAERRRCWEEQLATVGAVLEPEEIDALAERFSMTSVKIAETVLAARNYACLRAAGRPSSFVSTCRGEEGIDGMGQSPDPQPTLQDLFAAARLQSGHQLAALTQKIRPNYTWNDIVLPGDVLGQLREVCQRVAHRHRVMSEWGFDRKLSQGKGINVLFAGSSGVGKTMAAEVIANELGLDLYRIDLSQCVSKYIGETEKNLDRIFTAASVAESVNVVLCFDEADALFGKRSEVRDSHDRYANMEISYLLQKMEQYEGLTILATNLRQNLDDAFVRRMAFTIQFPFPDEAQRRQIWKRIWPDERLLSEEADLDFLARQFKLSGGNIKNIALAAAFLAAEDGTLVTMAHLIRATRREYQKLGKPLTEAELGPFAMEASA